jgi:hypothetical protein
MERRSYSTLAWLLLAATPTVWPASPTPKPSPALFARCEAAAAKRFGNVAALARLEKGGLKRLHGSEPAFPELPYGTRGSGVALHEVLIGPEGKVKAVWPVREPRFEPAFPAFAEAIVAALKTWEYEPHRSGGEAVPACMVVRTDIHWR